MKTLKIIIVAFLAIALGSNSYAQTHDHSQMNMSKPKAVSNMDMAKSKVETIKVWGNCEMCEARIEKAAKIEGVTKVSWDTETKMLSLVYDPSKTNSDDIQKKIAAVGYDSEKFKGDDKAYAKLPGCCKYNRKK